MLRSVSASCSVPSARTAGPVRRPNQGRDVRDLDAVRPRARVERSPYRDPRTAAGTRPRRCGRTARRQRRPQVPDVEDARGARGETTSTHPPSVADLSRPGAPVPFDVCRRTVSPDDRWTGRPSCADAFTRSPWHMEACTAPLIGMTASDGPPPPRRPGRKRSGGGLRGERRTGLQRRPDSRHRRRLDRWFARASGGRIGSVGRSDLDGRRRVGERPGAERTHRTGTRDRAPFAGQNPEAETRELAAIFRDRGLDPRAAQIAEGVMSIPTSPSTCTRRTRRRPRRGSQPLPGGAGVVRGVRDRCVGAAAPVVRRRGHPRRGRLPWATAAALVGWLVGTLTERSESAPPSGKSSSPCSPAVRPTRSAACWASVS